MLSGMRRGLKSIDFYQAVPSDLSEGTISGACISIIVISTLGVLVGLTCYDFSRPRIGSDLIVDQEHLDLKLKVNLDISFPSYPCSMLSLDIENILKVHEVNIGGTLAKYNLPDNSLFTETNDRELKKRRMFQDFKANKGCLMKGWFHIDRVPGNFHFSCHGYADVIQQFFDEGGYMNAHKNIDLTHQIHELWFGDSKEEQSNTLEGFHSQKEIGEVYLGISYTYFLDIVESNQLKYGASQAQSDRYYYTVRMNEVILASFPLVYFKYETNPITIVTYEEYGQWHQLFVRLVGIVGGIFTVASIVDGLVHSSIHFLLQKHRLNKLR